ncbi:MAG: thermonuclease family protein [Alphaproteobacteria bacterium]|nr:thermonuclease family protein [Alphaproteobacteria bacterium]
MTRLKSFIKYMAVLAAAFFISHKIGTRQIVVDGDTLILGREKIRFSAVDAPEIKQTCTCGGEKTNCGVQAKKALADFIGSNTVSCAPSGRDVYGRLLAECFITAGSEKTSLNTLMVRAGMAVVISKSNEALLSEEAKAIRGKKGIWGCEDFQMPADFRKSDQNSRSIRVSD